MRSARRLIVACIAMPSVIVACGSGSDFSESYMALDGAGTRKRASFFTDTESIFCVGEVTAAQKGLTVNAIVRQVQADLRPVNIVIAVGEQVPQQPGKNVLSFQLVRYAAGSTGMQDEADQPWPAGKYQCELLVDGEVKSTVPFDILTPNCPLYPAAQGVRCSGFYPASIKCLSADQTVSCTCSPDMGTWQCAQ